MCMWDATYTFSRCCDTATYGAAGGARLFGTFRHFSDPFWTHFGRPSGPDTECWIGTAQYASCCLPEGGTVAPPPAPPSGKGRRLQGKGGGNAADDALICICHVGFVTDDSGRTCTPAPLCTPTTCQNGGICEEQTGYTNCRCGGGYTGLHCETAPPWDNHGMGDVCNTDPTNPDPNADCAGKQASVCHMSEAKEATPADPSADPPRPARPAQPEKYTCVVTNCNAGECPTQHLTPSVEEGGGTTFVAVLSLFCGCFVPSSFSHVFSDRR